MLLLSAGRNIPVQSQLGGSFCSTLAPRLFDAARVRGQGHHGRQDQAALPLPRAFNDRLLMGLFYADLENVTHTFASSLSMVDDITSHHVAEVLESRSAEEITAKLVAGWSR